MKEPSPGYGYAINVGSRPVKFQIDTSARAPSRRYELAPGEVEELAMGYLVPVATANPRKPLDPIIVRLTDGLVVPLESKEGRAALARRDNSSGSKRKG